LVRVIYSLFEAQMLEFLWRRKTSSDVKKQTRTAFRKLVELGLWVLSFIQNYDLLKHYTNNLKNIVENVSGSNRKKKKERLVPVQSQLKHLTCLYKKSTFTVGLENRSVKRLNRGPQARPRRFWVTPVHKSAWWDNSVDQTLISEEEREKFWMIQGQSV